jgi:hypothetical protein
MAQYMLTSVSRRRTLEKPFLMIIDLLIWTATAPALWGMLRLPRQLATMHGTGRNQGGPFTVGPRPGRFFPKSLQGAKPHEDFAGRISSGAIIEIEPVYRYKTAGTVQPSDY